MKKPFHADESPAGPGSPSGNPWPFLIPLLVVLLIPNLFPVGQAPGREAIDAATVDQVVERPEPGEATSAPRQGMLVYSVLAQTLAGALLLTYFFPEYRRHFSLQWSPTAILVGVIGVLLWIGICELQWERKLLNLAGLGFLLPARPGINPHAEFGSTPWFAAFILFRFAVLVVVIPIAEELLIRGWLIRWAHDSDDWEQVSLKKVGWYGYGALLAYAVATHPQESLAAIAWFSLVHWMMLRTGRFWDCVVAHAVTNGLLGVYIMGTGAWHYW